MGAEEMPTTKMYAVILTEDGANQLSPVMHSMLRKSDNVSYFNSPRIDPAGAYFHLVLRQKISEGEEIDIELQIPHWAVLAVLYSADLKRMGF